MWMRLVAVKVVRRRRGEMIGPIRYEIFHTLREARALVLLVCPRPRVDQKLDDRCQPAPLADWHLASWGAKQVTETYLNPGRPNGITKMRRALRKRYKIVLSLSLGASRHIDIGAKFYSRGHASISWHLPCGLQHCLPLEDKFSLPLSHAAGKPRDDAGLAAAWSCSCDPGRNSRWIKKPTVHGRGARSGSSVSWE